jgi:hypothetical protein
VAFVRVGAGVAVKQHPTSSGGDELFSLARLLSDSRIARANSILVSERAYPQGRQARNNNLPDLTLLRNDTSKNEQTCQEFVLKRQFFISCY